MQETGVRNAAHGADKFGFKNLAEVRWNLTAAPLYEYAVAGKEASLAIDEALAGRDVRALEASFAAYLRKLHGE